MPANGDGCPGRAGLRDTGELINQPHVQVNGSSSHASTSLLGGTLMVLGGERALHGTSLWDVKATLGKRWRHKAERETLILKAGLKCQELG